MIRRIDDVNFSGLFFYVLPTVLLLSCSLAVALIRGHWRLCYIRF